MSTDRPTHRPVSEAFRREAVKPIGFTHSLPTIHGEGIIPPWHPMPARVVGLPLEVFDDALLHTETSELVKLVDEKLRLEDERMRRILPSLPVGYSWRGEIRSAERFDFARGEGSVTMRIVYRLHGPDGLLVELSAREAWARTNNDG